MGVNLRDLFPLKPVPDDWWHGKRIAVDGHNVAWRYLTSIRGPDGGALQNKQGRTISHLLGLTGIVRQFRERGAEPIVVWDGPVHPRKQATVDARIALREETLRRLEEARAAGDEKAAHSLMRGTIWLTQDMVEDCSRLLETLGVAVVTADHDGERFGAALCHGGHADAVATEDYDALVAGAPYVLRKAGGQSNALHEGTDLDAHGLNLDQLRQVAIVCGTDWHPGIKGFGAKTAVKVLREHGDFRVLFDAVEAGELSSRPHKLIEASGMDRATFDDLDAFIGALPSPPAPRQPKPCPDMATETAAELGISSDRVLSCFC